MKITCDFCKTEYNLDKIPNTSVQCAVCGHVWTPRMPFSKNATIKLILSIRALIAACIFCLVVVLNFSNGSKNRPLITKIDEKNIHIVTDENGAKRIFVSGDITNTTDDIYGLPNIVIISYDSHDNVLSRQAFVPPSTLLEPKTTVTFNHMLSVDPTHVKRLSVELKESK
ncbi:MAG: zinc-ribbon domain-containing protein [Alphaproteobacteria bacterium]|nr:zinc-ribbon domain-containing protein [Alphaproteobacteria bacterium]